MVRQLRSILGGPFGGAMAGALAVTAAELVALGAPAAGFDLGGAVVSLLAALGLALGFVLWLTEMAADRLLLSPLLSALLRALPALPPLAWLGRILFQGAFAATLPGASLGPFWIPAAGTLFLAAAIALGSWLLSRPTPARRILVAGSCLLAGAAVEVANRRFYPTEYGDLHALLIPVSILFLAAGVRAAVFADRATPDRFSRAGTLAWSVTTAAVVFGLGMSLAGGLEQQESRWALATRGNHGRHMVRMVRDRFDGDGDGYARLLGGGDCDDAEAKVNPGAAEAPGNRVDEDCDGEDAAVAARQVAAETENARSRASFADAPARVELLRRAATWNVLIISVDALRADVVADTAENRKAFPSLFALFDRSVRFDRGFAPASGTDLSVSSTITGVVNPFRLIDTTLFEAVARSGRATHAILPREVLRYAGKTLLTRGLDDHEIVVNDKEERDVSSSTSSRETTRLALAALDTLAAGDRPWLLWVHYFDAHEHLQIHADDPDLAAVASGFDLSTREGKYRALVALVDRQIGAVLERLDRAELTERTAIVFFSDHGESLGEDPRLPDNHGLYVYQPLVRIPIALHAPGAPAARLDAPVSLLDLAPTILELLGIEPLPDLVGRSLVPALVPGAPPDLIASPRPLPLNEQDQWGVVLWPRKLMVRPKDNLVELYDLSRDPGEHENLAERDPDSVRELKSLYQAFPAVNLDRTRKGRAARDKLALPPARR